MGLFVLSVIPALILMVYIYRKDRIEKEPLGFLARLFGLGVALTIAAAIAETFLSWVWSMFIDPESTAFIVIENFLIVALIEEGGKYFIFRKWAWDAPYFDHTFDAVVYAAVISLGFATLENILYVSGEGLGIAIMRGIMSVPGHAIDAVFMGFYFGAAKRYSFIDSRLMNKNIRLALIIPLLLHGFYDFCLSMDSYIWLGIFAAFEVCVTIAAFKKVNDLSANDTHIMGGRTIYEHELTNL